ncbi:orotidine-5'-phosphate decarboxylase [Helicobacter sp. 11S03491-1]|uniref:orotidine-5'-phosphate decarboxylase n=1 Tax=Helicobacter sp. 11S03491-1 TaxID=1476196 RepID=UPI000BA5AF05|nr:orotidine-5'-phosphate decarboxylase [Helicobacter sp. 11S03491-1]PAF41463.1 orotidine 5'-phosphate decarboxylase [Helicobacter sp. 11S03491-1]
MRLCIALDLEEKSQNLKLLDLLKGLDIWVKVGLRSYIRDGANFIEEIRKIDPNFKIFLDLKLYDIPNTMADAAFECAKIGVDMITLHASSGKIAMQNVMERLKKYSHPPLVFAITALTSFDEQDFRNIYNAPLSQHAIMLAKLAFASGLDGAVCSVHESMLIKQATQSSFFTLTPGIRPFCENNDDQKRVSDILGAKKALSDFIVIGRPIYKNPDPLGTVQKILKML